MPRFLHRHASDSHEQLRRKWPPGKLHISSARRRRQPLHRPLLLPLCMLFAIYAQLTAIGTSAFGGEGDRQDLDHALQLSPQQYRRRHHNCVHDEKIDEFMANVDESSLLAPQRLAPHADSYKQSFVMDGFLDAIGLPVSRSSPQRGLATEATTGASFQPIRIAFDLSKLSSDPGYMCTEPGETVMLDGSQSYRCSSADLLTSSKKEFIISVLLKAISDRFKAALSVQRVIGNLIVAGIACGSDAVWACCSRFVPSSYRTEGVANADYLLHVTARPTTGSTIAWALPCNIDQYGRPISGHANFGPARIDPLSAVSRDEQIGTALHEMTHALVFSRSRFPDFRQPLNGAKWGYSNVVSQATTSSNVVVSKIVTPAVVKQVKQHFNCWDWPDAGLELENGDNGGADFSSHWEKRVVMNEYMSATSSYDPVYSAMTLALFEDSGWYQVSYTAAEPMAWGYLEGCGVARSRCSTWNSRYICSDASQDACTADGNAKGYCNIATYRSSIPAGFQYFRDPTLGGRDTYADYCPFYRAYSNGDCRNIGRTPTTINSDNWLEVAGASSKCFRSSLSVRGSDSASLRPTCYEVLGCTSSALRLLIGGNTVDCPLAGGEVTVGGLRGKLQCPDTGARICQLLENKCSGAGVLLSTGKCQCLSGYTGNDCSLRTCPAMATSDGANDECGASSGRGSCDRSTGMCVCNSAYTGLSCSELVCPAPDSVITASKSSSECSGHGSCDRESGACTCADGYSGIACECVPGCLTDDASTCSNDQGTCDCITGACVCSAGFFGVQCATTGSPLLVELQLPTDEDAGATTITSGVVNDKEYSFYKIYLNSSTYDVTFVLTSDGGTDVDADLYGSFEDELPTSLTTASVRFASARDAGETDVVHLCGTLGAFPRGLEDPFRYCSRATPSFVQNTPGYFYLSVLGFIGGSYTLTVETDKCRGVTCSDHGTCGLQYPGVCRCDRYWSGDDCSVPKCGPDCEDLGVCDAGDWATTTEESLMGVATGALRNTSECYGNGICQAPSSPTDEPMCVCDAAYYFPNPSSRDQELCRQLVPSIAYLRHYTEPFTTASDLLDLYVKVGTWALFTLEIKDEWEVVVATLLSMTPEADAMLFLRKEKLPTTTDERSSASATSSSVQYTDTASWMAGSVTRKVVLSRATSTLSSGLYYIGLYNSPYGRSDLRYQLAVNATASCGAIDGSNSSSSDNATDSYGICQNGGTCNVLASDICSCSDEFAGAFCDLSVSRLSLASAPSTAWVSYEAFNMTSVRTLGIGAWQYFSFDVPDTLARFAQVELLITNRLDIATPARPILLVRPPSESDFPSLSVGALQDFAGIQTRSNVQVIQVSIQSAACSFDANHKHCYKLAVHNRATAGAALHYTLRVELFSSIASAFPSATMCVSNSSSSGTSTSCLGHGMCSLVSDQDDSSAVVPSCTCATGWTGLRCGSPSAFDPSQLWHALNTISLLCSSCSSAEFSLTRGEVRLFRVPEPLRANVGLRITVEPASSDSSVIPNLYVSEIMPRSIFDFTYISSSSDSVIAQSVDLSNGSLTGQFWVLVYSELATANSVTTVSSLAEGPSANSSTRSHRRRRRLTASSSSSSSSSTATATFHLVATPFKLPDDDEELISDKSFVLETFTWLAHAPLGVAVLAFGFVSLCLVFSFCLWRVCYAPDNQDALVARHFGLERRGKRRLSKTNMADTPAVSLAPIGSAIVVDSGDLSAEDAGPSITHRDVEMGLVPPATHEAGQRAAGNGSRASRRQ